MVRSIQGRRLSLDLHFDVETRCVLDLEEVGLDNYLASETFEVIMGQYAIDDGKVYLWEPHKQS